MTDNFDIIVTRILAKARAKGWMIATAESCTGGMVSAALTAIPGSSDVFDRGFVTYSNDAKSNMLSVRAETLASNGAVSEAVALEMAAGACAHSKADLSVSITGIAGPGGNKNKAEGMVCFAINCPDVATTATTMHFGALGRANVRAEACKQALALLERQLDA